MATRQSQIVATVGSSTPAMKVPICTPDCLIPVTTPLAPGATLSTMSVLVAGLPHPCGIPVSRATTNRNR